MKDAEVVLKSDNADFQMLYFTCSSLSQDDSTLYGLTDMTGSPNIFSYDLGTGKLSILSDNEDGVLRSYVYFNGEWDKGLGKASVVLDSERNILYYIQENEIRRIKDGTIAKLNNVRDDRVTAFMHVSPDGKMLAVPSTDRRALEYDLDTEGYGLDRRPVFSVDERCIKENLSSYLSFYDTETGALLREVTVPGCWITHVVFSPVNPSLMLFNNEWTCRDTGIRRVWLYDWDKGYRQLRCEGDARSRNDWVCHELWSPDGQWVIYHGEKMGGAFVGRIDPVSGECQEILLDKSFRAYGHFTVDGLSNLICDGYFRFPDDKDIVRDNPTDNGPDPHKKNGRYVSLVLPDWKNGVLEWHPLASHDTDWLSQDSHPHPVADHSNHHIYFSSRRDKTIGIYRVAY